MSSLAFLLGSILRTVPLACLQWCIDASWTVSPWFPLGVVKTMAFFSSLSTVFFASYSEDMCSVVGYLRKRARNWTTRWGVWFEVMDCQTRFFCFPLNYTKREALFNFYLPQGKFNEHNLEAQGLVKLFTMFLIHTVTAHFKTSTFHLTNV